jgi:hypothetical protein
MRLGDGYPERGYHVSIGAIVLGYLTFGVAVILLGFLTDMAFSPLTRDPYSARNVAFFLVSLFNGSAAAVLAGYIAAISARRHEKRHGYVLTGVIALSASASLSTARDVSRWYVWVAFLTVAATASLGALLRARQVRPAHAVDTRDKT